MTRREIFESIFDTNLDFIVAECDEMFFTETLEDEDFESIKERMKAFDTPEQQENMDPIIFAEPYQNTTTPEQLRQLMQPSKDAITITMNKGTLKYSGQGYVAYKKDWFRKHFATEVEIMTYFDGYRKEQEKTKSSVPLSEIYRVIAGHSDYHGDNILAALTCIAEGKEVDTVKPLSQPTSDDCVSRAEMLKYQQYLHGKMSNEENHKLWEFIKALPPVTPVTPTQSWIPIITREPTEEEKKDYFEQNGEELCYMIDSPMPNNGQEVLVSVGDTVGEDIFDEDFWNFEGWDIADVEAWMPLPKPYEEK